MGEHWGSTFICFLTELSLPPLQGPAPSCAIRTDILSPTCQGRASGEASLGLRQGPALAAGPRTHAPSSQIRGGHHIHETRHLSTLLPAPSPWPPHPSGAEESLSTWKQRWRSVPASLEKSFPASLHILEFLIFCDNIFENDLVPLSLTNGETKVQKRGV